MMILPFSARLRGTLFTLTLTLLSGCALIQMSLPRSPSSIRSRPSWRR